MEDAAQVALERLRGDWPRWNIWTVTKAIGGTVWCAHSSGDERNVLNEESAADLEWAMTSASQYRLAGGGRRDLGGWFGRRARWGWFYASARLQVAN